MSEVLKLVEQVGKVCRKCKVEKPFDEFSPHHKDGNFNNQCKKCVSKNTREWALNNVERYKLRTREYYLNNKEKTKARTKKWAQNNRSRVNARANAYNRANPDKVRNHGLKYKYGITLSEYNSLLLEQNSNCAICGINQSELNRPLYVDHCHSTGKVRGLLCRKCNVSIGMLGDSIDLVEKSLIYLKEKQ
jgi:hypothetical protein